MPVILPGDLNEWFVRGRPLRRLVTHFYCARSLRTFPTRYPLFALERIRVYSGERLLKVDAHRSAPARRASDRYLLVARIARDVPLEQR